jgi:RNA polymerase sigma-70 factor (ECF subfamily)
MTTGDEELLSELKNSDRNAYEVLFRKYYASLFHQVWYRCKDRDLAEDIVQEAFLRLWLRRRELKPHLPLFPFLITISVNLLRDYQRHSGVAHRHNESVRASAEPTAEDPVETVSAVLLQERISDVVNRYLSEACRSIFVLSRIEGKSNPEIAEILSVSRKTVENQLYHALVVLRKKLSAYK